MSRNRKLWNQFRWFVSEGIRAIHLLHALHIKSVHHLCCFFSTYLYYLVQSECELKISQILPIPNSSYVESTNSDQYIPFAHNKKAYDIKSWNRSHSCSLI